MKNKNKISKNPDDYNLVFHEPKVPVIKVGKITEHKDGSASYEIFYDNDLVLMIKNSLKLSKNPTKKQINKFLLDALEETMDRMDKEENNK
jgi:hypothetical protein